MMKYHVNTVTYYLSNTVPQKPVVELARELHSRRVAPMRALPRAQKPGAWLLGWRRERRRGRHHQYRGAGAPRIGLVLHVA